MSTSTIDDVQSRIAVIQQRLGIKPATTSSTAQSFSDSLSSAISSGDTSDVSSLLSSLSGGSSDSTNSSTTSGFQVVADATKYLGVPYKYGGTDPATGLDCSGLVQQVYGDMGITLPRTAAQQATQGTAVASLAQAQPGDLVAFGSPVDHIGIYAGDNKMIVAPKTGDVVKVESVYTTPTAIRRILPDTSGSTSASSLLASLTGSSSSSSSMSTLLTSLQSLSSNSSSSTGSGNFGSLSSQYNSLFTAAGNKYGISPTLLAAVAKQESGFNASAKSGAGAQGLMQLMPGTAKSLGVSNPFDASQAIDGAAKMLSGLAKKYNGSTSLALAAYNAGAGAVDKYNGIPPYSETQNYVKNILAMQSGVKA